MPPLPKYHGSMNLDGEAIAILSVGNDRVQEVKAGQRIGQFTLLDVNTRDITFQWKDQQVRKSLNEVAGPFAGRNSTAASASNNPAPAGPSAPPPPAIKSQIGPVGEASQFGRRACDPNDSYPDRSGGGRLAKGILAHAVRRCLLLGTREIERD